MISSLPPAGDRVAFVDARHGWAGGRAGLLGTADGRRFVLESHLPVAGISAVDRTHAWVLTARGSVLRTTDGRHWQRLVSPHLAGLQFVDRRHGFALTRRGVLLASTDGGRIWKRIHAPGVAQTMCFADTRSGIVARRGTVWWTRDAGTTWHAHRFLPERRGSPRPEAGCRARDRWVLFHEGVATGSEGYVVFRSRDAAATWRPVPANLDLAFTGRAPAISSGYSGPFDVLGAGRAVFVGICAPCGKQPTGTVARTANGGRTWRRATSFDGVWVEAVAFLDLRRGFALTTSRRGRPRAGILWRTRNGGRTWKALVESSALVSS